MKANQQPFDLFVAKLARRKLLQIATSFLMFDSGCVEGAYCLQQWLLNYCQKEIFEDRVNLLREFELTNDSPAFSGCSPAFFKLPSFADQN